MVAGALTLGLGAFGAAPSYGATGDPIFVFSPVPPPPPNSPSPPPTGRLNGPCGLAVDSRGNFYVSDYYHHAVDAFSPDHFYFSQSAGDPLDGPCQIALDSTDSLYLNDFHQYVAKGGTLFDSNHPTGVAVDTSNDHVYVDDRTYVSVYESSGAPVLDGGVPLQIGLGSLGDAFSLAVSQFPATAGDIYVADAAARTVKVYDPAAADKANPVQTITGPGAGFNSLREGAVAVDRVTGNVYVADNLQPLFTEQPEAVIDVFASTGSFLGRLKYKVVDALPPGLAVDNSAAVTQGRVYVTSGNTDQASVYAYAPGSQVANALPATQTLRVVSAGTGGGEITSAQAGGIDCDGDCEAQVRSGAEVTLRAAADSNSV